jgi:hypothetical protein
MNKAAWLLMTIPPIVKNGRFSNGTAYWIPTANVSLAAGDGRLTVTCIGGLSNKHAGQTLRTVVGRTYRLSATIEADAANAIAASARIFVYDSDLLGVKLAEQTVSANGALTTVAIQFTATTTTTFIQLAVASSAAWGSTGDKAYFDDIVVR